MKAKKFGALFLSIVLVLGLLVAPAASADSIFTDVNPSDWFYDEVMFAYEKGLVNGTSSTEFSPYDSMNRAMFVTVLGRLHGVDMDNYPGSSFPDVEAGSWYGPYVEWAVENNIVTGSGGMFNTEDRITRQQMATIIARYVEQFSLSLDSTGEAAVSSFRDEQDIDDWAREGVELMRATGIIKGDNDGNFNPGNDASRAEAATIFMRLSQLMNLEEASVSDEEEQDSEIVEPEPEPEEEEPATEIPSTGGGSTGGGSTGGGSTGGGSTGGGSTGGGSTPPDNGNENTGDDGDDDTQNGDGQGGEEDEDEQPAVDYAVFTLSNDPDGEIQIISRDGQLVLSSLPDDDQFETVILELADESGKNLNQKKVRAEDGSAVYPVESVSDGSYYLQLYTRVGEDQYAGYIYSKRLPLELSDGISEFVQSPVYEHNASVYTGKRTDSDILDSYLGATANIQSRDEQIVALAQEITSGLTDDYAKVRAIHDWVSDNIVYDYSASDSASNTALATLNNGRGVCQGYANLTAALLRASGIPAKYVTGITVDDSNWTQDAIDGVSGTSHAWNEAYVDGRWVILDTTWDSSDTNGRVSRLYFDPTLELFSTTHRIKDYWEKSLPDTAAALEAQVLVDGRTVDVDLYTVNGAPCVRLQDLATLLDGTAAQMDIQWSVLGEYDGQTFYSESVILNIGEGYTPIGGELEGESVDGETLYGSQIVLHVFDGDSYKVMTATGYIANGGDTCLYRDRAYFSLTELARCLSFSFQFDGDTVSIVTE